MVVSSAYLGPAQLTELPADHVDDENEGEGRGEDGEVVQILPPDAGSAGGSTRTFPVGKGRFSTFSQILTCSQFCYRSKRTISKLILGQKDTLQYFKKINYVSTVLVFVLNAELHIFMHKA